MLLNFLIGFSTVTAIVGSCLGVGFIKAKINKERHNGILDFFIDGFCFLALIYVAYVALSLLGNELIQIFN